MLVNTINKELYDHLIWITERNCHKFQEEFQDDYLRVLDACLNEYLKLVSRAIIDTIFFAKVSFNCHYMNKIAYSYMQGKRSTAFAQLKNALKSNNDLFITEIPPQESFYRMRTFDKRKGLNRTDLFHVPMNQRRKIETQRYSAPGYPCLYLGKSIYDCWEEMQRPDTETTLVSCFHSQAIIRVLDLRMPTFNEFFQDQEKYFQLFPFIIACSIPVRGANDVFKPEYIIPQLILEWTIEKNTEKNKPIMGVYYTSVNRNEDFYVGLDHEWDNLALPVQNALNSELYCSTLKRLFLCTKPTCYEYEHIKSNINATGLWDSGPIRNDPVGTKNDYYRSLFSRMEELLENKRYDFIDTEEID